MCFVFSASEPNKKRKVDECCNSQDGGEDHPRKKRKLLLLRSRTSTEVVNYPEVEANLIFCTKMCQSSFDKLTVK